MHWKLRKDVKFHKAKFKLQTLSKTSMFQKLFIQKSILEYSNAAYIIFQKNCKKNSVQEMSLDVEPLNNAVPMNSIQTL